MLLRRIISRTRWRCRANYHARRFFPRLLDLRTYLGQWLLFYVICLVYTTLMCLVNNFLLEYLLYWLRLLQLESTPSDFDIVWSRLFQPAASIFRHTLNYYSYKKPYVCSYTCTCNPHPFNLCFVSFELSYEPSYTLTIECNAGLLNVMTTQS